MVFVVLLFEFEPQAHNHQQMLIPIRMVQVGADGVAHTARYMGGRVRQPLLEEVC